MKLNNKQRHNSLNRSISAIFVTLILSTLCFATIMPVSAAPSDQEDKFPDRTPLQTALMRQLDIKKMSVMITSDTRFNPSNIEYSTEVLDKSENHMKIKGKTIIEFDNPTEAGIVDNRWPALQISENPKLKGEGTVIPGDYDQTIKDYILSKILEIEDEDLRARKLAEWNEYDFESGPRKHTITEYYEITYPDPEEAQSVLSYSAMSGSSTTTNDVLMGFTWVAPEIDWIIEDELEILGFTAMASKVLLSQFFESESN